MHSATSRRDEQLEPAMSDNLFVTQTRDKATLGRLLTTAEAARILGVSVRRVQALIAQKRIRATRHGRDWAIAPAALWPVADRRPGRPRKAV